MPPETRYAESPDGLIAYQVLGDGPIDLLYLSGSTSHLDVRWESPRAAQFMERLASFSRLIVFDRRGTGLSDPVPIDSPPTWEQWVDDLRVVLDAAGSQRTAILATLDGGPMAMLFAAMYPDRTAALVLLNTAARLHAGPDYPVGLPQEQIDLQLKLFEQGWGTEAFAQVLAPGLADDPQTRAWFAKYMRASATPRALAAQVRAMTSLDARAALPLIKAPTLVANRRYFFPIPVAAGRYVAEHIEGARFEELDGSDSSYLFSNDSHMILDMVEEFLTGAKSVPDADRILATILFTDLVDSTKRAVDLGDQRWRDFLDRHDEIARTMIAGHRGRMLKTTGDGVLATFDTPGRAIRCAVAMRDAVAAFGLSMRAGLHVGEVEVRGEDVGGIAVHIAARVSSVAEAGEVLVSRTVVDLVAGSGIRFDARAARPLKGLDGEWHLFSVVA